MTSSLMSPTVPKFIKIGLGVASTNFGEVVGLQTVFFCGAILLELWTQPTLGA
jgi:hypothetical protein